MAFQAVLSELKQRGLPRPRTHLLASYGVLNYPELGGDYARIGIALYGVLSTQADTDAWAHQLRPVLSLKARVATVKPLYTQEAVGYGLSCTADDPMKIATLSIGYADGAAGAAYPTAAGMYCFADKRHRFLEKYAWTKPS